jgi:exopolysaccharide production protein ExoY
MRNYEMSDLTNASFVSSGPYEAAASPWSISAIRPVYASVPKRCLDLAGALLLVIFFLPLLSCIALLLWLEDGSPILFRQRRIGAGNREFWCLKFRTMSLDAERILLNHLATTPSAHDEWQQYHKLRDDPRVTTLGALLRRSSLDELPQLFNVLRGEMSLVGPRPITADEIPRYGDRFHDYLRCRPGLTGLWQISRGGRVSYSRRTELDSLYVGNWSLRRDVLILAKTVSTVIRGSGAY